MGTPCLALKHRSDNKLYRIQVRDMDPVYLMQVAFEMAENSAILASCLRDAFRILC